MAKHYKNIVCYRHYVAISYKASKCPKKEDHIAQQCIAYKGKYLAWARECPV
jgi:hypothetical protein